MLLQTVRTLYSTHMLHRLLLEPLVVVHPTQQCPVFQFALVSLERLLCRRLVAQRPRRIQQRRG